MAYEKKIEPITRWEFVMAGATLQLFVIMYVVLPWSSMTEDCIDIVYKGSVDSETDMETFHDCMKTHKSGFLAGCACLMIGFPAIIAHLYYFNRIGDTILSFVNWGLSYWLYTASWGIGATVFCTLVPALGIFISYYDWELDSTDSYVGYAMQFQFFHFWLILWDCCILPLGIACSVPWFRTVGVLCGCCKSSHYSLTQQGKEYVVGKNFLNLKYGRIVLIIIFLTLGLICLFGAFADALDFAKDGFWSYGGGSQFLDTMILIGIELQCITYFRGACRFDQNVAYLNENVQSMASQDAVNQQ